MDGSPQEDPGAAGRERVVEKLQQGAEWKHEAVGCTVQFVLADRFLVDCRICTCQRPVRLLLGILVACPPCAAPAVHLEATQKPA